MSRTISLTPNVRGFAADGTVSIVTAPDPEGLRRRELQTERRKAANEAASAAEKRYSEQLAELRAAQQKRCELCGQRFDGFLGGMKKEMGQRVIELAIELTETIVRHRLPDVDMIRKILVQTLEPIADLQGAKVRLAAADAQAVEAENGLESLPTMISDAVEIVPDTTLNQGDIVIESRNGWFDAHLDKRLEMLKERLLERYRNGDASQPNA